jgi:hypothetical protein
MNNSPTDINPRDRPYDSYNPEELSRRRDQGMRGVDTPYTRAAVRDSALTDILKS